MTSLRRTGLVAAATAAPVALAYRFALVYRARAGQPRRHPPRFTPADFGLAYEAIEVPTPHGTLPGWFVPADGGRPGPGVVLVHGWESARDRTLPNIRFLHAAGFHCLAFDVRGHGTNPAEVLPISVGEFGADALAAVDALLARPEVTTAAVFGHSMGGSGAILAAANHPRVAALVSVSAPSDPNRLTRQTFRLARLPIPDPFASALAWLTTKVYLRPRGHRVEDVSARAAIARYPGPILLAHGALDQIMPVTHLHRLASAAGDARRRSGLGPLEVHVVRDGQHSWLHEHAGFRRSVARFLSDSLGGPFHPDEAAGRAERAEAPRLPEVIDRFSAVDEAPGAAFTIGQFAGAVPLRATGSNSESNAERDPKPAT
ncbi:MAG: alpha/beta fold hydrolase [Chloroflexi bacterium]|nr:alpha/beta fold hydrolase [Chloroflexota bacterium]